MLLALTPVSPGAITQGLPESSGSLRYLYRTRGALPEAHALLLQKCSDVPSNTGC